MKKLSSAGKRLVILNAYNENLLLLLFKVEMAMITTVTTTTTTTLTTDAAAGLILIAILTLIALMVKKEIFSGLLGVSASRVSRVLTVGIVPLAAVFLIVVVLRVVDVLR